MTSSSPFFQLWFRFAKPFWKIISIGVIVLAISKYLEIRLATLLGQIINMLATSTDRANIIHLSWIFLGLAGILALLTLSARYCIISSSRKIECVMRQHAVKNLLNQNQAFYGRNRIGDLISRLTSDMEQIRALFGPCVLYFFDMLFMSIMIAWSVANKELHFAKILVIPIVMVLIALIALMRIFSKFPGPSQNKLAEMSQFTHEILQNIPLIQSYDKASIFNRRFQNINSELTKLNINMGKTRAFTRPLIIGSLYTCMLIVLASFSKGNPMPIGEFVILIRYIELLTLPIIEFELLQMFYYRGRVALQRFSTFLHDSTQHANQSIHSQHSSLFQKFMDPIIEFRNLDFIYPNSKKIVLQNVSFSISNKENIVIMGHTGAGKTTLLQLLLQFFDPPENTVFFSGQAVEKIDKNQLREHIRYFPQDNFIFPETIRYNIELGMRSNFIPSISDNEHLDDIFKMVSFQNDLKSLPKQYNTGIEKQGLHLSGGQKQKIGLARTFYPKKTSIYLFDDPFANMDIHTQKNILQTIYQNFQDQTLVFILHQIISFHYFDKLVILKNGSVDSIFHKAELRSFQKGKLPQTLQEYTYAFNQFAN